MKCSGIYMDIIYKTMDNTKMSGCSNTMSGKMLIKSKRNFIINSFNMSILTLIKDLFPKQ